MNILNKILKALHSMTGTVIAVFFFMWFCTGLVLIYHPYPNLDSALKNHMKENLNADSLRSISYYTDSLTADTIQNIKVYQNLGQTLIKVSTAGGSNTMCADTTEKKHEIKFSDVENIAHRWVAATPVTVDTLHERAQWIMFERYEKAMPIYKFTYDDDEQHQLFVSGKTGEVQQITTREQRLWAYVGAIPHKFYFECIRKDVDLWKTLITIGGIICLIAALSGFIHGITLQVKVYRKRRKLVNPFRKPAHKWHHALGLIFGIFIIGWGISGSLAMQKVPKWLVPYQHEYSMHADDIWEGDSLPLSKFQLDYRKVAAAYPDVKQIEWHIIGNKPVYTVVSDSNEVFVDASDTVCKPLHVDKDGVILAMNRLYGDSHDIQVELMTEYDEYYMPSFDTNPVLPVYRATIDNEDGDVYYVGVNDDYCRFYNSNKKARKWLFGGFHYLNIRYLTTHPLLWTVCIWILCLAGAAISFTGIILGIRYIKRKL